MQWKESEDVVPGTMENIPSDCLRVLTEWTSVLEARGTVPGEFSKSVFSSRLLFMRLIGFLDRRECGEHSGMHCWFRAKFEQYVVLLLFFSLLLIWISCSSRDDPDDASSIVRYRHHHHLHLVTHRMNQRLLCSYPRVRFSFPPSKPSSVIVLMWFIEFNSTVWVYLFFLPFQLVGEFGWSSIVGVGIAAFIYLGFLAAGEEIEQPFGKRMNHDHIVINV